MKTLSVIDSNLKSKLTRESVSEIFFKVRQLCSIDIDRDDLKIGEVNKKVEIDESLYARFTISQVDFDKLISERVGEQDQEAIIHEAEDEYDE
ncbi:unnamed protein product [Brachionus calyciflorus]|uniref:Uncharacterized protein n=1 Tax=Brachionus calyciflorus TaxID=104777 RepID=A0A814GWA4_9BILA|nr:unnamed protein product [Brachionus calyciflorus]